jgi:hypothetical protein
LLQHITSFKFPKEIISIEAKEYQNEEGKKQTYIRVDETFECRCLDYRTLLKNYLN